jgi:hypothetical protein
MQVDCRVQTDAEEHVLTVTGTTAAKGVLSPVLEREIGRRFDPGAAAWRISLNEAWKLIDCCAVL